MLNLHPFHVTVEQEAWWPYCSTEKGSQLILSSLFKIMPKKKINKWKCAAKYFMQVEWIDFGGGFARKMWTIVLTIVFIEIKLGSVKKNTV